MRSCKRYLDLTIARGVFMIESKYLKENIENIQRLMSISALKHFETRNLGKLLRLSKIRQYEDGETIIQEGDMDPWLYFLLSGKIRITKEGEEIGSISKKGEIFGEMRIIDDQTRSATVLVRWEDHLPGRGHLGRQPALHLRSKGRAPGFFASALPDFRRIHDLPPAPDQRRVDPGQKRGAAPGGEKPSIRIEDERRCRLGKLNEIDVMRKTVSFTRHSANIFFHLLTRCNLRCRHCYINPDQHGRHTLDIDTIDRWLTLFADRHPSANVIFLGGEPTMHPDLSIAVKRSRQLGYASVTIDTNGYLFHDILDRVTPDEVDYFSFSLDGPARRSTIPCAERAASSSVRAASLAAKKRGFAVSLIYTVSRANIDHLQGMPPLLGELGVDRFFIQVIGVRGSGPMMPNSVETLAQVDRDTWLAVIPPGGRSRRPAGHYRHLPQGVP
jgi:uncharacterized radical SAM superfamily Fe-S cluster-containing enzyme